MIVVWRVTQFCNLSCPFCAYDRRVHWNRHEADVGVIRQFGAVLAEYRRATNEPVMVSWMGGEPFLFGALSCLTEHFTRDLGLQVSATTNGTALRSAPLREHVVEHYSELTVSVDGIGPAHDALRGWPGGYAALGLVVAELVKAKRERGRGPRLRANVVIMRQTVDDFQRLCTELANWGIEEITFNQLGGRDRPEFFPGHRLLPEQAASLNQKVVKIREQLASLDVFLKGSPAYLSRIETSSRGETIPIADCRPGEQFLFINENGFAAPCHFTDRDYGVAVTELIDGDALRKLPELFAAARNRRKSIFCEDCHSTRVFDKFAA